jgi:hypothetical protein
MASVASKQQPQQQPQQPPPRSSTQGTWSPYHDPAPAALRSRGDFDVHTRNTGQIPQWGRGPYGLVADPRR